MRLQKKSAVLRSDNCYIEVSWYSGLYNERWCNSKSYTTPNRTRSIVKTILELHLKKKYLHFFSKWKVYRIGKNNGYYQSNRWILIFKSICSKHQNVNIEDIKIL